jgi:hypothetical protein
MLVVAGTDSIVWGESPDQDLLPQATHYVRRKTILKGTPAPVGLSPSDMHRHARSLLQNRTLLGDFRSPGHSRRRSSQDARLSPAPIVSFDTQHSSRSRLLKGATHHVGQSSVR